MAQINGQPWNPPKFTFYTDHQASSWKKFYKGAIHLLTSLNIDPEKEDQHRTGWKQIKVMIKGEDRQILQTYIDNNTITQEDQRIPTQALKAIRATIQLKKVRNLQNSLQEWYKIYTTAQTTQTQHTMNLQHHLQDQIQSQRALNLHHSKTMQHIFQDHPAVQNQQNNTNNHARNLQVQNAANRPSHHAYQFQMAQVAPRTATPAPQ